MLSEFSSGSFDPRSVLLTVGAAPSFTEALITFVRVQPRAAIFFDDPLNVHRTSVYNSVPRAQWFDIPQSRVRTGSGGGLFSPEESGSRLLSHECLMTLIEHGTHRRNRIL